MNIDVIRNIDIEKYILGGMMLSNEGYYIATNYKLTKEDFYNTKHQTIFTTIKKVFEENNKIDLVLVAAKLKDNNELEAAGGVTYLTEVSEACLSIENIDVYIEKLKEYSKKRSLLDLSKYITSNLDKDSKDLEAEATKMILKSMGDEEASDNAESQGDEFLKFLEEVDKGEVSEYKTGLTALDNIIGGFNGGNLVTLFSFSNVGKTTLALQLALNNLNMKKKVLFFSLEMRMTELRAKMISNMVDVDYKYITQTKNKDPEMWCKLAEANDFLSKGFNVSNEDNLSNIVTKILYEVNKNDVDIIFIDYINLVTIAGFNKEEYQKNKICTRELKKLALKINKPIVILAQAKQEAASKMTNANLDIHEKLSVNDVAGGADIFRDSDIVIGMYRNTELDSITDPQARAEKIKYGSTNADENPECANLLIKKTRASRKGTIAVTYKADRSRIGNFQR